MIAGHFIGKKPSAQQLSVVQNFVKNYATNLHDFIGKLKKAYKYGPTALELFG